MTRLRTLAALLAAIAVIGPLAPTPAQAAPSPATAASRAVDPGGATTVWKRRNVTVVRGSWQTVGTHRITGESKWTVSLQLILDLGTATGNPIRGRNTTIGWARLGWGDEQRNGRDTTGAADNAIAARNDRLYQHSLSHEMAGGGKLAWRVKVGGTGTVKATLLTFKATKWSVNAAAGRPVSYDDSGVDTSTTPAEDESSDDSGGGAFGPTDDANASSGVCSLPGVSLVCDAVGSATSGAANGAAEAIIKAVAQTFFAAWWNLQRSIMTSWMAVPTLGTDQLVALGGQTRNWLAWLTMWVLVGSLLASAARTMLSRDVRGLGDFARVLVTTVAVSALGVSVVAASLAAADSVANALISTPADMFFSDDGHAMLGGLMAMAPGVPILAGIIGAVGSLVQLCILLGRNALLPVVVALLPLAAATGGFQLGKTWFSRLASWTLALILYKPVAALIYAVAFAAPGNDPGNPITAFTALAGMVMALLALPALFKLLAPVTAGGGGAGGSMAAGMAGSAGARALTSNGGRSSAPTSSPIPGSAAPGSAAVGGAGAGAASAGGAAGGAGAVVGAVSGAVRAGAATAQQAASE